MFKSTPCIGNYGSSTPERDLLSKGQTLNNLTERYRVSLRTKKRKEGDSVTYKTLVVRLLVLSQVTGRQAYVLVFRRDIEIGR